MSTVEQINEAIKHVDSNQVSDGYHTFGELYEHRIILYMALCRKLSDDGAPVWLSKAHSDGSVWDDWFILGIYMQAGKQITYHLPDKYLEECKRFATVFDKAPEYDGHTSADVLTRLSNIGTKQKTAN